MKKDFERIVIFVVAVYLLIQDYVDNKNNYEIFKSMYIEKEEKNEIDYEFDYCISNPQRWKRKMKTIINIFSIDVLRKIFNEIMLLYHKILQK